MESSKETGEQKQREEMRRYILLYVSFCRNQQ